MKITKKTEERIKNNLAKFQKVLAIAKDRDLNESDTVSIITDMLSEVFGYEKYIEITSELAIRGTYCDVAIKLNDKIEYLIECKAVGIDLKDNHLRQAIGYGANKGIQWIILTNGIEWQVHKLKFEQPIQCELVAKFNMNEISLKNERDIQKLAIITKEGVEKGFRGELYDKIQCVNKFVIGQLILNEPVISTIRKEIKKLSDGINVDEGEIISLLKDNIIRREICDETSDDVILAANKVVKFYKQSAKKAVPRVVKKVENEKVEEPVVEQSLSDQLLAEEQSSNNNDNNTIIVES
jgi:predicted type IV restriction endonuclease